MSKRGSYKSLTIEQKIEVLKCIDKGDSVQSVLRDFGISKSTFYDIKKSRSAITNFSLNRDFDSASEIKRKRMTPAKTSDIDEAVWTWYKQQRAAGVPIRGIELQTAAERFATRFQNQDFKASTGWLFRFRNRHGIANRSICGELLSADHEAVQPYKDKLQKIINDNELEPWQIYNADETGLFWKAMPKNTQSSKKETHTPGHKINKMRLSALLCANSDGTHKLKSVVGKSKNPRAMKNINETDLPVIYKAHRNAWFSCEIFSSWFHNNFIPSVTTFQMEEKNVAREEVKAVLLLDNAPVHPAEDILRSDNGKIKCLFMPPNTSALIQPMDQGVIYSCKRLYRKKQLQDCLVFFEDEEGCSTSLGEQTLINMKNYNIKNALFNWASSWKEVKATTIANSWKKLLNPEDNEEEDFNGIEEDDYRNILENAGEHETNTENIREWLDEDAGEVGYVVQSEEEIAATIEGRQTKGLMTDDQNGDDDDDEEENDHEESENVKISDAIKNVQSLLKFVEMPANSDLSKYFFVLSEMKQDFVRKQLKTKYTQKKVSDFFKKL